MVLWIINIGGLKMNITKLFSKLLAIASFGLSSFVFAIPNANQGEMAIYPKTYRATSIVNSKDPVNAILAQTSYLARILIQANDIFPPSHISSRSNGEIYSSAAIPMVYNLKMLEQVSVYRNSLGARASTDQYVGSAVRTVEKVANDWVQYHIMNYCDPLAASIGTYGLYDCNKPYLQAISSGSPSKQSGITAWEQVGYGADISANSLLQPNIRRDQAEAAMRYVYHLTNIVPEAMDPERGYTIPQTHMTVVDGVPKLTNNGFGFYMQYLEDQSKISLSQHTLMKLLSERLQMDSIKISKTIWDESGNKVETAPEPASPYALLEFEATKRFKDPAWYDRVQQMPTPALLKEIAYMEAMRLALEFKKYEQQQMQIALQASMASDLARLVKNSSTAGAAAAQAVNPEDYGAPSKAQLDGAKRTAANLQKYSRFYF